jgi:DNA-binding response OmpR family regulator
MHALIVESNPALGKEWARYLKGLGAQVTLAATGEQAFRHIHDVTFDVIVLDLVLREGSALAIADLAYFRQPSANVVFVTDTTFFSDGSIFRHSGNARALIESHTPATDLAAIVHHYGVRSPARAAHQASVQH